MTRIWYLWLSCKRFILCLCKKNSWPWIKSISTCFYRDKARTTVYKVKQSKNFIFFNKVTNHRGKLKKKNGSCVRNKGLKPKFVPFPIYTWENFHAFLIQKYSSEFFLCILSFVWRRKQSIIFHGEWRNIRRELHFYIVCVCLYTFFIYLLSKVGSFLHDFPRAILAHHKIIRFFFLIKTICFVRKHPSNLSAMARLIGK